MKTRSWFFVFSVLIAISLFTASCGRARKDPSLGSISDEWTRIFQIIDERYVDPVNHYACFQKTQAGGLSACLDKFSEYFSGKDWKVFSSALTGNYVGVGMIMRRDGFVIKLFPYPGTPAAKAGILPNDVLVRVNVVKIDQEKEVSESDLKRAADLVRGESDTTVQIVVRRGNAVIGPLSITRKQVTVPSVLYKKIAPHVGYVRIFHFSESTEVDFPKAMNALTNGGKEKDVSFIFDIRGNPGGLVDSVTNVVTTMAPAGKNLLLTLKYKDRIEEKKTGAKGMFGDARGVILTDGFSASASEIFAGTLQDWGKFKLVGDHTYGKGVGQVMIPLYPLRSDTPVLKLTVFHYLVGNSRKPILPEQGLTPDYPVDGTLKPEDIEKLRKDIKAQDPTGLYLNPEIDKPLKKALELLSK